MTAPTTTAEPSPALRIRPGTAVLDRGDGELQLGTDPRWALVVSGLTAAESAWILEASERRHRSLVDVARRHGVDDARRVRIMDVLVRSGYLVSPKVSDATITAPAQGAADIAVLGALRPDGAGLATLAARAERTVGISGLGRIGAGVAVHLASAGVGTVVLGDRRPVQMTDLGLGIFRQDDVGRPRESALRDVLAERTPRTTTALELDARSRPDVVVVIESHVADPRRNQRLVGAGIDHLSVVVREADVMVGPLVLPGRSPCVQCCDLHALDVDDVWPELAAQLRKEHAESGMPEETTLAAAAAAVSAGQVLALLDGARPVAVGAVLEIALPEAVPRVRTVQSHPDCGCSTLPG